MPYWFTRTDAILVLAEGRPLGETACFGAAFLLDELVVLMLVAMWAIAAQNRCINHQCHSDPEPAEREEAALPPPRSSEAPALHQRSRSLTPSPSASSGSGFGMTHREESVYTPRPALSHGRMEKLTPHRCLRRPRACESPPGLVPTCLHS